MCVRQSQIVAIACLLLTMMVIESRAQSVPVEIISTSGLPVRIDKALISNLEHRADIDYSVTSLTGSPVWNFEVVLLILNPQGKIVKRFPICVNHVIEREEDRCRYFPPGEGIEAHQSEDLGVILHERVDLPNRAFVALREVRTEEGIWQISNSDLTKAITASLNQKPYQLEIKNVPHVSLTVADKLSVIAPTLDLAIAKKRIPDYGLIKNKELFVLSTDNLPTSADKIARRFNLLLLTNTQIQEKANAEGDFLFLRFGEIKGNGDKIFVVLINTWVKSEKSDKIYLSGGGMFLEFRKVNSRWIGRQVGGWIS